MHVSCNGHHTRQPRTLPALTHIGPVNMSGEVRTGEGKEPSRWLELLWARRRPHCARTREQHLLTSDVELNTTTTMFSISPPLSSLPLPMQAGWGRRTPSYPTRSLRLATNRRCSPAEAPHVEHTLTPRSAPLALRTLSTMVMKTRRDTADKAAANKDARRQQVLPPMPTADETDLRAKLVPDLRG